MRRGEVVQQLWRWRGDTPMTGFVSVLLQEVRRVLVKLIVELRRCSGDRKRVHGNEVRRCSVGVVGRVL